MDIVQKKSYEKFPVEIDFSPDLVPGETVLSQVVTCVDTATGLSSSGTLISSSSLATPVVTVIIQAGAIGEKHHIQVLATTSLGNIYDKDLILCIVEPIEGEFNKQPGDKLIVAADFTNRLATGETLSSKTVTATRKADGIDLTSTVVYASSIDGSKVLIGLQAGADGDIYQVTAKAVTSLGYQCQIGFLMSVKEL